jgi:hypothetical protein
MIELIKGVLVLLDGALGNVWRSWQSSWLMGFVGVVVEVLEEIVDLLNI